MDLVKRFLGYTAVDTQSDEYSESVPSTEKQKNLAIAAEHYIYEHRIVKEAQFDIVSILYDESGEAAVEYIERAFFPIY